MADKSTKAKSKEKKSKEKKSKQKSKEKKSKQKQKLEKKINTIRKYINFDKSHPGSLTPQQFVMKNGKKTKKYYSWQGSYQGKKKTIRVPDSEVEAVRQLIADAERETRIDDKHDEVVLKAIDRSYAELTKRNAKIRRDNEDNPFKGKVSK